MVTIASYDTALNLVYVELKGRTVAQIRTQAHQMLVRGEIDLAVYEGVQDIIRRWGN
jgi:predicted SpoU family rRNA methylase